MLKAIKKAIREFINIRNTSKFFSLKNRDKTIYYIINEKQVFGSNHPTIYAAKLDDIEYMTDDNSMLLRVTMLSGIFKGNKTTYRSERNKSFVFSNNKKICRLEIEAFSPHTFIYITKDIKQLKKILNAIYKTRLDKLYCIREGNIHQVYESYKKNIKFIKKFTIDN